MFIASDNIVILIFLDVTPCSLVSSTIMKRRPKAPLKYYNLRDNIWTGTVGLVCTYWLWYGMEGSLFQSRQRQETLFSPHQPHRYWDPHSSLFNGHRASLFWTSNGGVNLTTHLRLEQMLKMSTAIHLPPSPNPHPVYLHSVDRNFTFNIPLYSWWSISWRWRQYVPP